jgi:hypothetical protein
MSVNLCLSRRLARRLAMVVTAVLVCCAAVRPASANPIVPTYIYGIGDANRIWQTDPVPGQQSFEMSYNTGISGTSNAVAFDRSREQLLFLSQTNDLYVWNKSLGQAPGAFQMVTTGSALGISGVPVFNASYYQNSFWFFKEATNELVKATLDYSTPTLPTLSGTTSWTTTGPTPSNYNGFGDIAINENTGTLYAATSTGLFYSLDLGSPSTSYNEILPYGTNISLQIAFNQDYSVLYGHSYATGEWYSINTTSGVPTDLNYATIVPGTGHGFRDLGGSSTISAAIVPEIDAASFGSVMALLLGSLGWLERRRRAPVAA